MLVEAINNPRKPNGDFGDYRCDLCGSASGAYILLDNTVVCKGCLLGWIDMINETVLQDAVEKGRLREKEK